MVVAVLYPQDCVKDPFFRDNFTPSHMKFLRNPSRPKRPQPNRRRRSLPLSQTNSPPRSQTNSPPPSQRNSPPRSLTNSLPRSLTNCSPSPPSGRVAASSKVSDKKSNHLAIGQVRILKRGEEITKLTADLASEEPDLASPLRIESDLEKAPTRIDIAEQNLSPSELYAGPVTFTSPPPSELPFPAFFAKKSVSVSKINDATSDLIRILRLDIA